MICVYRSMFLLLSLQNQLQFAGEPFLLSETNVFITRGLLRESKHKVNKIIAKYLKWRALTGQICHNRVEFMLWSRWQNESKRLDLYVKRG